MDVGKIIKSFLKFLGTTIYNVALIAVVIATFYGGYLLGVGIVDWVAALWA